ncbi:helix-turn-helix domain-containing protein [Streptomyces chrestomyceticus]|uniref:helix-turn-helix domain-containing protein n=1 Tax=Streptomyces chrestomyceticus TaxID=68185 RepID=UPI000F62468E|nr:helix-turn-helix transcriptional regulator [Streptomyces chrestomyceticus]
MRSNGIAIRAIREAQNMSLPALARRAGIDRGYLSRLERGQIERPAEAKVQAIAAALTVPTAAITHEGADVPATEAKRKAPPTAETGGASSTALDELVHYKPEEVAANGWLPYTALTLRKKARAREIPHSRSGGRITFRLQHIREIAAMGETRPLSETKSA